MRMLWSLSESVLGCVDLSPEDWVARLAEGKEFQMRNLIAKAAFTKSLFI